MNRIRKNDLVQIISGKDKGRSGKVLRVFPQEMTALVEGVGVVKRHQKASPTGAPAGIVEKNSKIHLSKIALLDPKSKKPTRVRFKKEGDKKERVSAASGDLIQTAQSA